MKTKALSAVLATLFLGTLADAKTCQDEPERCEVLRWSCAEQTPDHVQNFKYLSASITNSIFTNDTLIVSERICSGTPLSCREQKSEGEWSLYPGNPKGLLVNQLNHQEIIVDCKAYNQDVP